MTSTFTPLDFYGVLLGGLVAILLGFLLFLRSLRRSPSGQIAGLVVFLGLGGAAVVVAQFDLPRSFVVSLSCLAGVWGLGWALRTSFPSRWALALFRTLGRPQVQALALLVGGLALLSAPLWALDQERLSGTHARPADFSAFTDGGSPIALFTAVNAAKLPEGAEQEEQPQETQQFALSGVRTAPASADSNCHGWVFTGGRFLVMGQDVERILAENGYEQVSDPEAGDLVVYRDASGQILHTGKVHVCAADKLLVYRDASGKILHTAKAPSDGTDDLVLVESKLSLGGTILHTPADQPYSPTWSFYRTRRGGHLLRGLEKAPPKQYPPAQPTDLIGA